MHSHELLLVITSSCCTGCQVHVAICVEGGETALITFTGVGYDARLMADAMNVGDASHFSGVPTLQRQILPRQVILSVHRCDYYSDHRGDVLVISYHVLCV